MNRQGRILLVEDLPKWQKRVSEILGLAGYKVEVAASQDEAVSRLKSGLFHLLIVDLSLREGDRTNEDGMNLLRSLEPFGIGEALAVIVLTAYPTPERVREAFAEHGVRDFLSKHKFDRKHLVATVVSIFEKERAERGIGINLELEIRWQGSLSPQEAVVNLRIGPDRVKRGDLWHSLLAEEFEDLLCRLFSRARSILIQPIGQGASGTGVLLVHPFYTEAGGQLEIVKFGDARKLEDEVGRYERYVANFIGGARTTALKDHRRSPRLGGIRYTFVGGDAARMVDFASFYRAAAQPEIEQALNLLFFDTCGAWYASPGRPEPLDLSEHYREWLGIKEAALENSMADLKSVDGKETLSFRSLDGASAFPNPVLTAYRRQMIFPTYQTITHGDLNPANILVDEQGRSWLIDFQRTGPGHYLRDVIELDVSIRIALLKREDATLAERLELERALCAPRTFSELRHATEVPVAKSPAVKKAFAACRHLRLLSHELVARHGSESLDEYRAGSLFCALNLVRFHSALSTVQREHALLSACLLGERLGL